MEAKARQPDVTGRVPVAGSGGQRRGASRAAPAGGARPTTDGSDLDDVVERIRLRIAALDLDLTGMTVITEAATGAYAVTAVSAAMAGAREVVAVARDTARHGRFEDAAQATLALAGRAGVAGRIAVSRTVPADALGRCDILTNTGHLRPIERATIDRLPPHCAIALMYEAWEFRAADLDLAACRERGIRVAGVNECHPAVGVFPFLGPLGARLLNDAGLQIPGRRVAILCDNPFAPFLATGIKQAGASVLLVDRVGAIPPGPWDAILVAMDPSRAPMLGSSDLTRIAAVAPKARVAQFWGSIDRTAAARQGIAVWPPVEPSPGHMGILLSALGYEPIIRLQVGGLRAAQLAHAGAVPGPDSVLELL